MMVSVIIPVFNGARFLAGAIESAIAQTHPADEILVIDDGSFDNSVAVARSFGTPVRVISQPNTGPGAARNAGILHSRGECVVFLDSDDLMLPDRISRQVAALEHPGVDIVLCGQWLFRDGELPRILDTPEEIELRLRPGLVPGAACVRRTAIDTYGAFLTDLRVGDFIEWFDRAISYGCHSKYLPEPLVFRRIHAANLSNSGRAGYAYLVKTIRDRRRRSLS